MPSTLYTPNTASLFELPLDYTDSRSTLSLGEMDVESFTEEEQVLICEIWSLEAVGKAEEQYIADPKHSIFGMEHFWARVYDGILKDRPEAINHLPHVVHQTHSFAGLLHLCLKNLKNLTVLDSYLANLGRRHGRVLGAEPHHYQILGEAMLKELHDHYGFRFSPRHAGLFIRLYCFLSNAMLQAGVVSQMLLTSGTVTQLVTDKAEVERAKDTVVASAPTSVEALRPVKSSGVMSRFFKSPHNPTTLKTYLRLKSEDALGSTLRSLPQR